MRLGHLPTDALEALVSGAILRAEYLEDGQAPLARSAWREVMELEIELSRRYPAASVPGGVARAGAAHAAFGAGEDGWELVDRFLAETDLPEERKLALQAVVSEHEARYSAQFPRLAEHHSARELNAWKHALAGTPEIIFPVAA